MDGRGTQAYNPTAPTPHAVNGLRQRLIWAAAPARRRPQTHPQQSQEAAIRSIALRPAHANAQHPCPAAYADSGSLAHTQTHASPAKGAACVSLSPVVPLAHTVVEPLAVVVKTAYTLVAGAAVLGASAPAGRGGRGTTWLASFFRTFPQTAGQRRGRQRDQGPRHQT